MGWIREFVRDEDGSDLVEYTLLIVLIGATGVFLLTSIGISVSELFSKVGGKVDQANNSIE